MLQWTRRHPDLSAALVGLVGPSLLYGWPESPDEGWQVGTVARLCPCAAFSHVAACTRQTSALCGTADTLLDASSYVARRVLLSSAPVTGVARALRPWASRP